MLNKMINSAIVILVGCSLLSEVEKQLYKGNDLIGWTIEKEKIDKKQTKQTYKEYVQERLEVERMMK